MITRSILEWTDKKKNEVINNPESDLNDCAKNGFALGLIEGGLDMLALLGATCIAMNLLNACRKRK